MGGAGGLKGRQEAPQVLQRHPRDKEQELSGVKSPNRDVRSAREADGSDSQLPLTCAFLRRTLFDTSHLGGHLVVDDGEW